VTRKPHDVLATREVRAQLPALLERFGELQARVASPKLWKSVLDQARFALARLEGDEAQAREKLLQALRSYAT